MAQAYDMEIGSFLRFSMENAKRHWIKYFGVILLGGGLLVAVPGVIGTLLGKIHAEFGFAVGLLLFILGGIGLSFGFIANVIRLASNRSFDIKAFIPNAGVFINFLLGMLCYMIIVSLGSLLFVIPGIILGIMFSLVPFLVIDKKMNFLEAFGESAKLTKGHKMDIFLGTFITNIVIGLLSIFIITLFFTIPMGAFLSVYPYVQLSGLADQPAAPQASAGTDVPGGAEQAPGTAPAPEPDPGEKPAAV
jgi:hypothetical protein